MAVWPAPGDPPCMPTKGGRPRTRATREARLQRVRALGERQGGVVSRPQLRELGITRGEIAAHLRGGRWQAVHTQGVAVHTAPLAEVGTWWAAVFEAGHRGCLDGASSLIAGGLEHYTEPTIRVSVPRGVLVRPASGVTIRQTRRLERSDVMPVGIPRTRNHVAAVRGALWARSDKQAALLLTMAVQQGLTSGELLGRELMRVRRDRRRMHVTAVVSDLVEGVRSLGEHEFAALCRMRGIPEPTRQALRRGRDGRLYLDVAWEEWGVVVEIDGIHHTWAASVVSDASRQNDVTLRDAVVLRLPLLGLRVAPEEFFTQVEQALSRGGWPGRHTNRASQATIRMT